MVYRSGMIFGAAEAPWWGTVLIAGLFTVLGAAVSQGVALWLRRDERREQAKHRWDERRIDVMTAFLTSLRTFQESYKSFDRDEVYVSVKALRRQEDDIKLMCSQSIINAAAEASINAREAADFLARLNESGGRPDTAELLAMGVVNPHERAGRLEREFGFTINRYLAACRSELGEEPLKLPYRPRPSDLMS